LHARPDRRHLAVGIEIKDEPATGLPAPPSG
jgi:hypothetical protein